MKFCLALLLCLLAEPAALAINMSKGDFASALCAALAQTKFDPNQPLLSQRSLILDTNIVRDREALKRIRQNYQNSNLRITMRGRDELIKQQRPQDAAMPGFRLDRVALERDYAGIMDELRNLHVGEGRHEADRQIVAEVFCADSSQGIPTLVTADQGIYENLYKNTPSGKMGISAKQVQSKGFEVELSGRKIFVIPVLGR